MKNIIWSLLSIFFVTSSANAEIDLLVCKAGNFEALCAQQSLNPESAECRALIAETRFECSNQPSQVGKWFEELYAKSSRFIGDQAITYFLGGLAALFALVSGYLKVALEKLRKRMFDPFMSRKEIYETLALNVLFVGEGGVGKTSLVRAISGSEDANPSVATAQNHLFSVAHEVTYQKNDVGTRRLLRLFLSDHVGQDWNSIQSTSFFTDKRLTGLPKCIVVVVDLFPPTEEFGEDLLFDEVNKKRIREQTAIFTPKLLRILSGGLQQGTPIVLFVNKLDKLMKIDGQAIVDVVKAYSKLIGNLRNIRGSHLHVIVGSAEVGLGVNASRRGAEGDVNEKSLYSILVDSAEEVHI